MRTACVLLSQSLANIYLHPPFCCCSSSPPPPPILLGIPQPLTPTRTHRCYSNLHVSTPTSFGWSSHWPCTPWASLCTHPTPRRPQGTPYIHQQTPPWCIFSPCKKSLGVCRGVLLAATNMVNMVNTHIVVFLQHQHAPSGSRRLLCKRRQYCNMQHSVQCHGMLSCWQCSERVQRG